MSIRWFKTKQLENGCFPSVGRILHKSMKGGLASGQSPAGLTAFVLIAMLDSGIDRQVSWHVKIGWFSPGLSLNNIISNS